MKTFLSASLAMGLVALGALAPSAASAGCPPSTALAREADTAVGFLDVASDPAAKIAIDGVDTGKTTPQLHLALAAGHHKLTLVTLDGAHQRNIGFAIEAGQTTKLTIHLAS